MTDPDGLPLPTRRGSALLPICFATIGAVETWLLSGVLPDPKLGGWIVFGTAVASAFAYLLGFWLARRAYEAHRWAFFALATLSAGAATGTVLAIACAVVQRGSMPEAPVIVVGGAVFGTVLSAVCFYLPLGIVYWAYTKAGRAREGSLIHAADRQRVWFVTIAIVFGGAAFAVLLNSPHGGKGALAIGSAFALFILWIRDIARMRRFFRGTENLTSCEDEPLSTESSTLDLGIGNAWWIRDPRKTTAYRSTSRKEGVVLGSIFDAQRILTWVTIVDTSVVVLAIGMSAYGVTRVPKSNPVYDGTPVRTAAAWDGSLSFYPQIRPIIYDANGDGVEDVIGLSWDSNHEEAALQIVAVDGTTLRPMWRTPLLRSQWDSPRTRLLRSADRLFLTDSESLLHIYDIHTGKEVITRDNPAYGTDSHEMCAAPTGDAHVWISTSREGFAGTGVLLNADGAQIPAADRPKWCHAEAKHPTCTEDPESTCTMSSAMLSISPKGATGYGLREGDVAVGLGETPRSYLVGFDPKTRKERFERSIAFNDDELHADPNIQIELHAGKLFSLYQKKDGNWILGARDGKTGEALWSKEPPNARRGTNFHSMTITDKRLYLVVEWKIEVFDPTTGQDIGTIW